MSQRKRVNTCHKDTTRHVKRPKHRQVWFCYECGLGPFNAVIDAGCASCGNRRCSLSSEGWVPVVERSIHDISPPQNQEPSCHAALPMTASHVPHSSRRAATPSDNTMSEISNLGLTSLSSVPQQTRIPGTRNIDSTRIQSETPSQQTNKFTSGQWHGGGYGNELVQVHVDGAIRDSVSSAGATSDDDTRSRLSNGSPQLVFDTDVDYSIHPTSEATGYTLGVLQSIQSHQVEHVAVATDASAPNMERQSIQGCVTPIYSGEINSDAIPSLWPASSDDASIQLPDLESHIHSIGSLPWDFNDCTVPLQPQLPLIDYHPLEPPPSSIESLDVLKPPKNGRGTKGASRHYECCEPGGSQRLACLFYKYDPRLHMGCMSKSFTNIGHLRQHLDKSHKLGPNHCMSCWKVFDTADKLANHTTTQCIPIGGVPVDDLPGFPKMRSPPDKKWYWGWRKIFGDAAVPPQCPFFHPVEDFEAQFRTEINIPSQPNYPDPDLGEDENPGYSKPAEEAPLSMSFEWQIDDETLLNITEGIAELVPEDIGNMSNSYPSTSMSPSTQSGDFDLDFDLQGPEEP